MYIEKSIILFQNPIMEHIGSNWLKKLNFPRKMFQNTIGEQRNDR